MRKICLVFDEALLAVDIPATSTCNRAPAENSPHRHFAVIQLEQDEGGAITKTAVTPGQHAKEVIQITKDLAVSGIPVVLPEDVEKRVIDNMDGKVLTLRREKNSSGVVSIFIDVRKSNEMGKALECVAEYPDTMADYKTARRLLLSKAAQLNLPIDDEVEQTAVSA